MRAVLKKELRIGFSRPELYAFAAITLLATGIAACINHLVLGYPDFQMSLPYTLWALIAAVPLLTMGAWRDERRQHTDRLINTLPLRTHSVVLGKFIAMLVPLIAVMLVIVGYVFLLTVLGATATRTALGLLLCCLSFGIFAIALGLFESVIARNRWDAYLSTAALLALACFAPQLATWLLSMNSAPLYAALIGALGFVLVWAFSHQINAALVGALIGVAVPLALIFTNQIALLNQLVNGLLRLLSRAGDVTAAQNGLLHADTMLVNLGLTAMLLLWADQWLRLKRREKEAKHDDA